MKYRVMAISLAILLVGCLWNNSRASSDVETYYPLSPRTMTYESYKNGVKDSAPVRVTIQQAREVDGARVIPYVMTGPPFKYPVTRLLRKAPEAVYQVGSQLADGTILKSDVKAPLVKNPVKEGVYFDSDVAFSTPGFPAMRSHYTLSVDKTDESLSVPMGRFTGCIKTKALVRMNNTIIEATAWLAPKIGVVKRIEVNKSKGATTVTELRLARVEYGAVPAAAQAPLPAGAKSAANAEWRLGVGSIMNMNGPQFLVLYIGAILVALLAGFILVRKSGGGEPELPTPPPSHPDAYETAYLRGGQREVILVAVFKLIRAGRLASVAKGRKIGRVDTAENPAGMSEFERLVYAVFETPQTLANACKRLSAPVAAHFSPLDQRLSDQGLITSRAAKSRARRVMAVLLAVILGLGGFRLIHALSVGHHNVGFLVVCAVFGSLLIIRVSSPPQLTRLGREYLKQLQTQVREGMKATGSDSGGAGAGLELLVAVLGLAVLEGTPFASYVKVLTLPTGSISGDDSGGYGGGGGCGGGGGGGGSGG
ncbi:MAG: TIGR04222 domain-containing membrane protein [Syntrophobacteraceae bacterium]|nr:TIGR04222 domain-containing membrane protein [Syntrophobacteraceae bacterium]